MGANKYANGSPFVYDELLARIRAVLRRSGSPPAAEWIEAGEIAIDRATRWVTVRGQRVALAGKEYELLLELASDPTRVFTKEQLLRDVWGYRLVGRTRTLDSHASRLRRKLGSVGEGPFVVNVWGVGRGVAAVGRRWRQVAWLHGFRVRRHGVKPPLFSTFGP